PTPIARSALHSSPQDGGPKGKMIEGRRGDLGGALEENCGPHLTAVLLNRRIAGLYRIRLSTPSRSLRRPRIPSLRRFLPVAPACWPQGKILPHPSARSALHSSPQNRGRTGLIISGRKGSSCRGCRRKMLALPDRGS